MNKLHALKIFETVAELEGFAAAAEKLGLSRNKVSREIAELEARLGARLLNRTTRRVSLTGTGAAYYENIRDALAQIETADAMAAQQAQSPQGQLKINAPMSFGIHRLAPVIADYMARFPQVTIDLDLNDRRIDLVEEGYDAAIRIGILEDSSLIARKLSEVEMICCASPDYLHQRGHPSHPDDLQTHDCWGYAYHPRGDHWRFTKTADLSDFVDFRFTAKGRTNNGDAAAELAIAGGGIVIQPDFIVESALADGRLRQVLADWHIGRIGVYAIYPSNRQVSFKVRSFIDHLIAAFSKAPQASTAPLP